MDTIFLTDFGRAIPFSDAKLRQNGMGALGWAQKATYTTLLETDIKKVQESVKYRHISFNFFFKILDP